MYQLYKTNRKHFDIFFLYYVWVLDFFIKNVINFCSFSLTLIDTLDTLVILGDLEEFEHAIKLVISGVSFDNDVIVSVFETNIRVLG